MDISCLKQNKKQREKIEKRQSKYKCKRSEEIIEISRIGNTTITDKNLFKKEFSLPLCIVIYLFRKKQNGLLGLNKQAYRHIGEEYIVCFAILHVSVGDTR